jgi:hypothetical protein
MTVGVPISDQMRKAIELADAALDSSAGKITVERFHDRIQAAADEVGGPIQLGDAQAALSGALVVLIAQLTSRSFDAALEYVSGQIARLPGLE